MSDSLIKLYKVLKFYKGKSFGIKEKYDVLVRFTSIRSEISKDKW